MTDLVTVSNCEIYGKALTAKKKTYFTTATSCLVWERDMKSIMSFHIIIIIKSRIADDPFSF